MLTNMNAELAKTIATAERMGRKARTVRKFLKMSGRQYRIHLRAGRRIEKQEAAK